MSKPYFAKYLPVEGEINIGDTVFITETSDESKPDYYKVELPEDIPQEWMPDVKVKLFLCSRDIQVDDEVINLEIDSTPVTVDNIVKNSVWFVETPGEYRLKDCFKIIGEISPKAKWVKEGDEFEEDEVELYNVIHAPELPISYCHIKGPCGHFH